MLQLSTPLAALLVVSGPRDVRTPCSLTSQEFCRSHGYAPDYPGFCIAPFNFLLCNSVIGFMPSNSQSWRASHRRIRSSGRIDLKARPTEVNVRFGSKADMCSATGHVRFAPESGHVRCKQECPLSANSGHCATYSITSSALASSDGGTVRPSALAVLRLITSSNLVGACTGMSDGFSPLRIRST